MATGMNSDAARAEYQIDAKVSSEMDRKANENPNATWEQYRKKPVVIWAYKNDKVRTIKTREGLMLAEVGDWIIRGVENEFYPCKPSVFEKCYEKVQLQPLTPMTGKDEKPNEYVKIYNSGGTSAIWTKAQIACYLDNRLKESHFNDVVDFVWFQLQEHERHAIKYANAAYTNGEINCKREIGQAIVNNMIERAKKNPKNFKSANKRNHHGNHKKKVKRA